MASFTNTSCPQFLGATAENLVVDQISKLTNQADTTLAQVLDQSLDMTELSFPMINLNVTFDDSGQLESFGTPQRPELPDTDPDAEQLTFVMPATPAKQKLGSVPAVDPDKNFPTLDENALTDFVSALRDMLTQATGLPASWEAANAANARDRIWREATAGEKQINADFARRGWAAPTGVQMARIDAVRDEREGRLAEASRDISLRQLEEALASLRIAAGLGGQYLQAWVQAHAGYTTGQGINTDAALRKNQQILDDLRAAVGLFDAQIRGEGGRIGSILQVLQQQLDRYGQDISLQGNIAQRDATAFSVETNRRIANSQVKIEQNRVSADTRNRDVQQAVTNFAARADMLRQVAAALYQGIGVSAGITSANNKGQTTSCATSWNFTETVDG